MSLLRYKKDQKVLVFDYETCCLSQLPDSIQLPFALGWNCYEGNKTIFEREDWLFWPSFIEKMNQWGKGAIAVTHWTEEEYLRRAGPPEPILEEFEKYLYDPNIISVGANSASFDLYIHNIHRRELGKETDWGWFKNHVDIQCLAKALDLGITPPKIGTDDWVFFNIKMSNYHKKGLKTNLAFMCKDLEVDYNPEFHHQAGYDTRLTYQCFQKQIQKMDILI